MARREYKTGYLRARPEYTPLELGRMIAEARDRGVPVKTLCTRFGYCPSRIWLLEKLARTSMDNKKIAEPDIS